MPKKPMARMKAETCYIVIGRADGLRYSVPFKTRGDAVGWLAACVAKPHEFRVVRVTITEDTRGK